MSNHLNQFQSHQDMQTAGPAGVWNMFFGETMTADMAKEVQVRIREDLQNILGYKMPYTKPRNLSMTDYFMDHNTLDEFQAHVQQKLGELSDSVQTVSGMRKWRDALQREWESLKNIFTDFDMKSKIEKHMSAILRNVKKIVKFLESVHEPVQYIQSVHEPPVKNKDSNKFSANLYFVQCPLPISWVR
jgi:hypothetical protein